VRQFFLPVERARITCEPKVKGGCSFYLPFKDGRPNFFTTL